MRKKERKIFASFRLSPEVLRELVLLSQQSGLGKTELVELGIMCVRPAVAALLVERYKKTKQGPDGEV